MSSEKDKAKTHKLALKGMLNSIISGDLANKPGSSRLVAEFVSS
jgi:hypothetical protein